LARIACAGRTTNREGRIVTTRVVELRLEAELKEAFPVVRQLHHELEERKYLDLLSEMVPNGYRMFAIREPSGEVAAVLGMQVLTNLYYQRHAYVYDLVVSEGARSTGYGGVLLDHAEEFARGEGCLYVALACGREREGALRFYEGRGYERPGYSMRKALR
jgi:GNAT superfamily N-acetyltransferase